MRVDKYLWCVRYFKTRNQASIACKKGHIRINGDVVKPSREVFLQDIIDLRKNQINYKIRVNDIPASRVSAKLVDIYRTDLTPKEEFEGRKLAKLASKYYRAKGEGRPTKKDRRDLDDYVEGID